MHISTYLYALDRPVPSADQALLVFAPDIREAAPLLARITGHDTSAVAEHLARVDARLTAAEAQADGAGASVTSHLERVLSGDELAMAGKSYTKRLARRLKAPPRTCRVSLVVTSGLSTIDGVQFDSARWQQAMGELRRALPVNGSTRGVIVVRGKRPAISWERMYSGEESNLTLDLIETYAAEEV